MIDANNLGFIFSMVSIPFVIVGLIGNVLVIRIVHKTREMHTATINLLANLAVSDVLTILILWPTTFIIYGFGHVSDALKGFICKGWWIASDTAILVSSFTLTLLAVERYHALLKPLRTGLRLSQDNIKQAMATVWFSSVLFSIPRVFLHEWEKTLFTCIPTSSVTKIHVILTCALCTYIPLIIFLFCYGSLIKGLYFSKTICATNTEEDRSSEKKKLVITFILATAGFVIGYTPIVVYYTIDAVYSFEFSELKTVFYFIFLCSLCLNPVLYAFRSTNFQEGFKRIIFCRKPPLQSGMQLS